MRRLKNHRGLLCTDFAFLICCCILAVVSDLRAQEDARAGIEFFEQKIRPVLVEHCYKCHSAKAEKIQGKLLLDTRDGIRKGGETGPVVVPGNVSESLLIEAIRYESLEMPPDGKLPDSVIADFVKWVEIGVPDPRKATTVARSDTTIDYDAARKHWAYQPITRPSLPSVQLPDWPASPIDNFVLAKLEERGLSPSPPADRRTLIRRAYYDLIGLPPTYEEVENFVNDPAPDAFERVVDRLLASPRYGERWGRHWLDVARYADTKDLVLLYGKDRIRPYSYTYRDYVVRAMNEDVPYDQFIQHQIAADKIEPPVESWKLAAMGFLTLGRLFDNNPHDVYDDQIDTVTRGFLGLTVACARCHDHKYDAIPTDDYYSLYGVFANSEAPIDLPLIAKPDKTPAYEEFEQKASALRQEIEQFNESQYKEITQTARERVVDYLVRVATTKPDLTEYAVFFLSLSPEDLKPQFVAAWRRYLERRAQPDDPVFGPWHDLMQIPDSQFTSTAPNVIARWLSTPEGIERGQINPLLKQALTDATINNMQDVAETYGELLKQLSAGQAASLSASTDQQSATESTADQLARDQLLATLTSNDSPFFIPKSHTYLYMTRVPRDTYSKKLLELDKLAVYNEAAPPRAMILVDSPQIREPRVLVRGNPSQPGDEVARQFLRVLTGENRKPFSDGSGRLELARAITSLGNPLTARVMVNRVWMHHFGEPLVSTPDDFGTRSDSPKHPDLLDYLAYEFQNSGWSLKALHRTIMLSSTYQHASFVSPLNPQSAIPNRQSIDPDNRLLWHFHRRRLDLESMRDTMLYVSGRLDSAMGGRTVDVAGDPLNRRRTIYGLVDRQDLPGLYRAFDFASPDQSAARRPQTTVPQQALFALNSPFVITQAKSLATRPEVADAASDDGRIKALYRIILSRNPDQKEIESAQRFFEAVSAELDSSDANRLRASEQFAQILLVTNELMFVD